MRVGRIVGAFLVGAVVMAGCGRVQESGVPTSRVPAAPAPDLEGTEYGAGVTLAETLAISDVHDRAEELEGQRVRVEGLVTGVCAKRGCWFRMASDREFEDLTFKVTDGEMVFPMEMTGKHAVAEGVVKRIRLDLEKSRAVLAHEAEEQGLEFDASSVTEPITIVRLDGTGAVVRDVVPLDSQ